MPSRDSLQCSRAHKHNYFFHAARLPLGTIVTLSTASRCGFLPSSRYPCRRIVATNAFPVSWNARLRRIFMRSGMPGRLTPWQNAVRQPFEASHHVAFQTEGEKELACRQSR